MKRNISLVMALLVSLMLSAATVTKDEARRKALQFLSEKQGTAAASRGLKPVQLQLNDGATTDKLYVFNVGQKGGFVIVSGDDCTGDAILGYADSGEIPSTGMPDNLKAWLQGYADEISWMQAHGISNDVAAKSRAMKASTPRSSISPLLATQWNQRAPYNNNCPMLNAEGTSQAVTGCVATAAAQVMYYQANKNNITSTTISKAVEQYNSTTYYWYFNGTQYAYMPEKPVTTIDWTKITTTYPSTTEANAEVAKLFEYVGAGVKMQYGPSSSASNSKVCEMLTTYFGYDTDIKTIYRKNYSYTEWLNAIYTELSENGPVLFGGQSMGGGHSFVFDGYSESDYFHVNWGWGGLSDGYYKLSVLNPSEQGAGGSTTTDGYNYDQDIMVNVNPIDDGVSNTEQARLTVIQFDNEYSSYIKYSNSDFGTMQGDVLHTGVKLNYAFRNYSGYTLSFDYGYALYQDDTMVQLIRNDTYNNISNTGGFNGYCYLQFGNGLADGEYKIIAVSRKAGTDTWYPCISSDQYYLKATVSGNDLTLNKVAMNTTSILSATLALKGDAVSGSPVTIIARISNSGYRYSDKVQLLRKNGSEYTLLAVRHMDVESETENKEFEISFTPEAGGDWDLVLRDKDDNQISGGTASISITNGPEATTGTLSIVSTVLNNGSFTDSEVYGTTAKATVTISNTSATNHTSGLKIILFHWTSKGGGYYSGSSVSSKTYALDIPAGGSKSLDFELGGMEKGDNLYGFTYYYIDGTKIENTGFFKSVACISTYDANGTVTSFKKTDAITIAEDVCAVDLSEVTGVTVTPNSSPNTLYYIGDGVTGLDGKNVVQNGTAANITIDDNYDFYTPKSFTATTVQYKRTFTQGANGTGGWSTIVLPFDVSSVKQGATAIDWFHNSSDTGKNFWVKKFISDDSNTVYFDFADDMKANTPYIIAVPGNTWGEKWNLINKEITFIGSDAWITANAKAGLSGNNYNFVGNTTTTSVTNCYVLNASGDTFTKSSATVKPFRAYFKATNISEATSIAIGSEGNKPTAITNVQQEKKADADAIYLLDGRRVKSLQKGINIVGGKKIVIK